MIRLKVISGSLLSRMTQENALESFRTQFFLALKAMKPSDLTTTFMIISQATQTQAVSRVTSHTGYLPTLSPVCRQVRKMVSKNLSFSSERSARCQLSSTAISCETRSMYNRAVLNSLKIAQVGRCCRWRGSTTAVKVKDNSFGNHPFATPRLASQSMATSSPGRNRLPF